MRNLNNRGHVTESRDQVHQVLAEYASNCYGNIPVSSQSKRTKYATFPPNKCASLLFLAWLLKYDFFHFRRESDSFRQYERVQEFEDFFFFFLVLAAVFLGCKLLFPISFNPFSDNKKK